MNIYLMADAEGLCGIHLRDQVSLDGKYYSELRQMMTEEINHCVESLKAAGAKQVMVRDAHASGNNVIWPELSSAADGYVMGNSAGKRMPGIEDYDAVVLLGYHAMAGTYKGILEHTMSSRHWQNCWINGVKCGETALDAAIAGEYGKPVILVSGDDCVCAEAKAILPQVVTAEVKQALSLEGAVHLPRPTAFRLLRVQMKQAVRALKKGEIKPYEVEKPVRLRIEVVERGSVPTAIARPDINILDGRTYEVEAGSVEEALARL